MKTIDPGKDLLSIGKLCELLKASPNQIERAAGRAGVRPVLRLNSISYFTDSDIDKIRRHLRKQKAAQT